MRRQVVPLQLVSLALSVCASAPSSQSSPATPVEAAKSRVCEISLTTPSQLLDARERVFWGSPTDDRIEVELLEVMEQEIGELDCAYFHDPLEGPSYFAASKEQLERLRTQYPQLFMVSSGGVQEIRITEAGWRPKPNGTWVLVAGMEVPKKFVGGGLVARDRPASTSKLRRLDVPRIGWTSSPASPPFEDDEELDDERLATIRAQVATQLQEPLRSDFTLDRSHVQVVRAALPSPYAFIVAWVVHDPESRRWTAPGPTGLFLLAEDGTALHMNVGSGDAIYNLNMLVDLNADSIDEIIIDWRAFEYVGWSLASWTGTQYAITEL